MSKNLQRAFNINAKIIGVNNRNLKTFDVDLIQTEEIAQHFHAQDVAFISESGIWNEKMRYVWRMLAQKLCLLANH